MNSVYAFFGGKKLFIAILLFVTASTMRFVGAWFSKEVLSENGWLIAVLVAVGAYGITNVATKIVHAFAKNKK